jgi:formylglycine-generating enzyme required for sulfatase activity
MVCGRSFAFDDDDDCYTDEHYSGAVKLIRDFFDIVGKDDLPDATVYGDMFGCCNEGEQMLSEKYCFDGLEYTDLCRNKSIYFYIVMQQKHLLPEENDRVFIDIALGIKNRQRVRWFCNSARIDVLVLNSKDSIKGQIEFILSPSGSTETEYMIIDNIVFNGVDIVEEDWTELLNEYLRKQRDIGKAEPIYDIPPKTGEPGCPPGMANIPLGTFMMGCNPEYDRCSTEYDSPQKLIRLTKGFCMDETEVTQEEYQRVTGDNPSEFADCGADCPVERVSWNDAKTYCLRTGKRLPTEAEWEYAARGGMATRFYWGREEVLADDYEWHEKNSDGGPKPVKQKKPNGYGLYDMLGNVGEWVYDCYFDNRLETAPENDPMADAPRCWRRVFRGSWWDIGIDSVDTRSEAPHIALTGGIGFRCAKDYEQ